MGPLMADRTRPGAKDPMIRGLCEKLLATLLALQIFGPVANAVPHECRLVFLYPRGASAPHGSISAGDRAEATVAVPYTCVGGEERLAADLAVSLVRWVGVTSRGNSSQVNLRVMETADAAKRTEPSLSSSSRADYTQKGFATVLALHLLNAHPCTPLLDVPLTSAYSLWTAAPSVAATAGRHQIGGLVVAWVAVEMVSLDAFLAGIACGTGPEDRPTAPMASVGSRSNCIVKNNPVFLGTAPPRSKWMLGCSEESSLGVLGWHRLGSDSQYRKKTEERQGQL
jgi:hypothetical protein